MPNCCNENRIMSWRRENVLKGKVPNKSGLYYMYNSKGKLIYVGHASRLRHRLQSYYQKDDYSVHRTKDELRPNINSFKFDAMPLRQAMCREKRIKKQTSYNFK